MKISGGLSDSGVVVGNTYDKYGSRNPVVRRIMRGFESALENLVEEAKPDSIHEVGCGEGYWVLRWSEQGRSVKGSDFSETVIELARKNAIQNDLSPDLFKQRSIYDLEPDEDGADLVVCCEVLEHLERPDLALLSLQRMVTKHVIFSVPREPLWSLLNMARGKYWAEYGNTPGHVQRWSQREFIELVSRYFKVKSILAPVPWTMLLCCSKGTANELVNQEDGSI